MTHHYTAVIVKSGGWFAGTVKELSGVHTQGKTIAEVKDNLQEAIAMVVESNLRHFVERIGEYEEYIEEDLAVTL
ncbi:MAG: type II toxin-antitoxin system HicB family antitoxin [bacterium]|nr:type II toxin-antitoxin system HicB family antitoxin [bacterium]